MLFNEEDFQVSIKQVFQSVGLSRLTTPSDPVGIFVTYQGENTPSDTRKNLLRCHLSLKNIDLQTVGENLIDVDMRANLNVDKDQDILSEDEELSEYENLDLDQEQTSEKMPVIEKDSSTAVLKIESDTAIEKENDEDEEKDSPKAVIEIESDSENDEDDEEVDDSENDSEEF